MYEIRPESIKTFIQDRSIKLPRFQRKQTWDDKKNFQLCISLFKEYPIGVTILSSDESGRVKWLLDGRQRKNALSKMFQDSENIYNWAKAFIKFKNSDQPDELESAFYKKINDYIEADDVENDYDSNDDNLDNNILEESCVNLELLLNIIKIIHNKRKGSNGFTEPFNFTKFVDKLPYKENDNSLSTKKVKTFIDDYRKFCEDENLDYQIQDSFYNFLDSKYNIKDTLTLKNTIKKNWQKIIERINIIDKIDIILNNSKIGVIEVKNLSASDSQKIFNIINSEGEKLSAVEILSAKPNWNKPIENLNQKTVDLVNELYKNMDINQDKVVRWDLPAILLKSIDSNFVFKKFSDNNSDFSKEITIGFKVMSCIFVGGIKKEHIDRLGKKNLDWSNEFNTLVNNLNSMFKIINSFDYFKYFGSWKKSLMDICSDAIAINFLVIAYQDWLRKDTPMGSNSEVIKFQKNCFILWDKLIYEFITKQWRGSSDQKIANNYNQLNSQPEMFTPIDKNKWLEILKEIFEHNKILEDDITTKIMEPLLYHSYCIKSISGPEEYEKDIDHIIPQTLFSNSTLINKEIIKDNILNLGILPKKENISKSNKKLNQIEDKWLKEQITKYEFIEENEFLNYSNINNYKDMFEKRKQIFLDIFNTLRDNILNN